MITATMANNGLDTRVSKTDSTGAKTFKRAGVGVTAAVLSDGAASYTPGISEKRGGASTFYSGGIKNTDTQTDASQAVTASRLYDAFGNVIASTGTWKSPFGNAGKFGYQEDPDTGLKLLGHRYYDSSTGRFLTRDPAYDGRNWYSYCDGNPVTFYDATGLKPGQKYKSADAAAKAAALENEGRSEKEGRELGGVIYENEDGTFSYTLVGGIEGKMKVGPTPKGKKRVGDWHTHPNKKGAPASPGFVYGDPDLPSPGDLVEITDDNVSYIISQSGIIWKFEKGKKGKPIGRTKPSPTKKTIF